MLARMMLAGVPVADSATAELAWIVRGAGAEMLADLISRGFRRRLRLRSRERVKAAALPDVAG